MSKTDDKDFYAGSLWSKVLGFLSCTLLILSGVFLISEVVTYNPISKETVSSRTPWEIVILLFVVGVVTAYVAYRFAGGSKNPAIWKDMSLYELLKYLVLSGQARVGLHRFRDQGLLLTHLESVGIQKGPAEDVGNFVRNKIIKDRKAFNILQKDIVIKMIHNGEERFWDGYGKKQPAQFFIKAEIILDVRSEAHYMLSEVLEGLVTKTQKNV